MDFSPLPIKRTLELLMAILLLFVVTALAIGINTVLKSNKALQEKNIPDIHTPDTHLAKPQNKFSEYTIAIDAGHGGIDPGKVGINQQLEKDINLSIALKLEHQLINNGFQVIMTRREDKGLYAEQDSNKKRTDMKNRVQIINEAPADLCISIHQNSYTSEHATGAQVFYYSKSETAKTIAGHIQKAFITEVDTTNKRSEKANHNYYLLLHTTCPSVIVECGFLSNWREATNLCDDYYQDKIANAITNAIKNYYASLNNEHHK